MSSPLDPSNELEELCEVSSSSSLATNALSSSNCNPTSSWLGDILLVRLSVVFGPTFGIFSFNILIVVCLRWHVLVNKKSYTSMSTLSNVRVDTLNRFFLLLFLLVLSTSFTISKECFLVNASREEVWYLWTTIDLIDCLVHPSLFLEFWQSKKYGPTHHPQPMLQPTFQIVAYANYLAILPLHFTIFLVPRKYLSIAAELDYWV